MQQDTQPAGRTRKADTPGPIKVATSAGRDVFLYANGAVQCGRVTYRGRSHVQEFRDIYKFIDHYVRRYRIAERDVSGPIRILTIEDLADDMEERRQATISVGRVRRLASEETVRRLVAERIFPVFMDYLNNRWRREFPKMSDEEKIKHPTADKLY
jgi:hypothetical protein